MSENLKRKNLKSEDLEGKDESKLHEKAEGELSNEEMLNTSGGTEFNRPAENIAEQKKRDQLMIDKGVNGDGEC